MQLQQQLASGQIIHVMDPDAIYVHVSQGNVVLHGSVDDQSQRDQAEQAISNIRGVQNVQNQLTVGGQQSWQQTGPRQQQFGQQSRQQQYGRQSGQQQSGQQSGEYPALGYIPGQEGQSSQQGSMQQDTGTGIAGDAQCIQMFKQGLTSQNLQSAAQNIYVTCHQGKMALYGYVKSNDEKNDLEKATKAVPGVKNVDNNLIVKKEGWQPKSDSEIQEDIESQLWWSPYVDSDKIQVSVQNGVATLSGQADDWDGMRAAVKNAYDGGAKRVRSQIQFNESGTTRSGRQTTGQDTTTGNTRTRGSSGTGQTGTGGSTGGR